MFEIPERYKLNNVPLCGSSTSHQPDDRKEKSWLFTSYKSKWNMTFRVVPRENFREQRNIWKGSPFFRTELPNGNSCLRGRFLVNGNDLCNGKRDSGLKSTRPDFCLLFAQTVKQPFSSTVIRLLSSTIIKPFQRLIRWSRKSLEVSWVPEVYFAHASDLHFCRSHLWFWIWQTVQSAISRVAIDHFGVALKTGSDCWTGCGTLSVLLAELHTKFW